MLGGNLQQYLHFQRLLTLFDLASYLHHFIQKDHPSMGYKFQLRCPYWRVCELNHLAMSGTSVAVFHSSKFANE